MSLSAFDFDAATPLAPAPTASAPSPHDPPASPGGARAGAPPANPSWQARYAELVAWRAARGDTCVPKAEGALGRWVARQRELKRSSKLDPARERALNAIGFVWNTVTAMWEERFRRLSAWRARHGHCAVPIAQGELGTWVSKQRQLRKRGKLAAEKVAALESLGFTWSTAEADWEDKFKRLCAWAAERGHASVPFNEGELGWWVNTQRQSKRKRKLSRPREDRLNSLGFVWNPSSARTKAAAGGRRREASPVSSWTDDAAADAAGRAEALQLPPGAGEHAGASATTSALRLLAQPHPKPTGGYGGKAEPFYAKAEAAYAKQDSVTPFAIGAPAPSVLPEELSAVYAPPPEAAPNTLHAHPSLGGPGAQTEGLLSPAPPPPGALGLWSPVDMASPPLPSSFYPTIPGALPGAVYPLQDHAGLPPPSLPPPSLPPSHFSQAASLQTHSDALEQLLGRNDAGPPAQQRACALFDARPTRTDG